MTLSHPEKEDGVARSVAAKCRECTSDVTIDPRDENHILTTDWFHICPDARQRRLDAQSRLETMTRSRGLTLPAGMGFGIIRV